MSTTTIEDGSRVDAGIDLIGREIDKYRVVRMIGKGGMGRVFEAVNTTINKRVALKLIDYELAKDRDVQARFRREALAASAVESPYIVQIFDAGTSEEGAPFLVMELLRGSDLGHLINDRGRLQVQEALSIGAQIMKGLHHAHDAGIVHRDLKPDNVFLVDRDEEPVAVKLLDFGVSKLASSEEVPLQTLTRQGTVVGTPFYMSPEQAQAFPDVDKRTDIYSLGAILFECLAGRTPHRGSSYEQVIVSICMHDAPDVRELNPAVPEPVAQLIAKALSREREDRFDSARSMLEALVQAAPDQLRGTPSSHLRISGSPGGVHVYTPQVISSPASQPAHELADTVAKPEQATEPEALQQSGVSTKSTRAITASSLEPEDDPIAAAPTMPARRRWPLMLAPGIALFTALVVYFSFSGTAKQDSEAVSAEERSDQEEELQAAKTPESEPAATAQPVESDALADEARRQAKADTEAQAAASASASARAFAAGPATPNVPKATATAPARARPATKPPPAATGTSNLVAPDPSEPKKPPTLELMPR